MLGGWFIAWHLASHAALGEEANALDSVLAGFGVPLTATAAVQPVEHNPQPVLVAEALEGDYWSGDALGDVNSVCDIDCNDCSPGGCLDDRCGGPWCWQTMPDGLMFQSYLAGPREPRFASIGNYQTQASVTS